MNYELIYRRFNKSTSMNNDYYKLAEQVSKLYEIKAKRVMQKLSEFILLLLKNELTIAEFNKKVLNCIGKSANSIEGIISDDSGVAPINTRINTVESIYNLIIYSCNFLQDGSDTPKRAKELILKNKNVIIESIVTFIESGNINATQSEFSYEKYIKRVDNFL